MTPDLRRATLGLVLVVSVIGIEAMAVATVLPSTTEDLGGLDHYSWAFTAFFVTHLLGVVEGGRRSDQDGPRAPLAVGMALFGAGLVIAGAAPTMEVFVLGRAVQGLGSGMQIVSLYVVVARVFPEELHGRAFAAMSAAWVLPAIVGPGLAGLVAEHLDWRWVFLGLVPVVVVGAVLVLSVTRTPPREQGAALAAPRATLGAAAVVAGSLAVLQLAGNEARWWSLPVAAVAVAVAVRPFTSLLPPGSLRLAPGVPSLVILRGLLCAAFFGAEAFIPLTLTRLHGMSPSEVGLPLTLGALGWGAGSWYQGRSPESRRLAMLRAGLVLVSAGILPLALLASTTAPTGVAVASWAVAGLGMGLAMPSISVVTLAASEPGMHGANSASLQICDITASVVAIGAAGSVLTGVAPHHAGEAVVGVYVALAGVAALGVIVTRRVLVSSRG